MKQFNDIWVELRRLGSLISSLSPSAIITAVANYFGGITKEPTGFKEPENVIVTGNVDRTITLSGTVGAYWRGIQIAALVSGWTSPAHGTDTTKTYYLYYDGSTFAWYDSLWTFDKLQITMCFYDTTTAAWVYAREVHGLMAQETHKELHLNLGSYKLATGGDFSNYVLASITATDRRPYISSFEHNDEDLATIQAALTTNAYMHAKLTGASVTQFGAATEIVPLSTNRPYYNQYTTAWGQTLMPANSVMSIWVVSFPAAQGSSQNYRLLFGQGQWITQATSSSAGAITAAITTEKTRLYSELNLGSLVNMSPEFLNVGRIIIAYTGGNWSIRSVEKVYGNAKTQVAVPAGNFLSSVTTDGVNITGNGTAVSPVTLSPNVAIDTLALNTSYTPTGSEPIGTAFWDDLTQTWVIRTGADTYLSLGAELSPTCKNGDSFTHLNGQPCYISSGTGKLTVLKLASALTHTASNIIYLATQDVLHTGNGRGKYTSYGAANTIPYTNVIKTGEDYALWAEGSELYLCDELGKLSVVKLPAPYHSNLVGYISDKSGSNISIEVHPSLGFELGDMHDVDLTKSKTTPIDTDVFLLRDSEDGSIFKKFTAANIKAWFATLFATKKYRVSAILTAAGWIANLQDIVLTGKQVTWGGFTTPDYDNTQLAGAANITINAIDSDTDSTFTFKCKTTPTSDIIITIEYEL